MVLKSQMTMTKKTMNLANNDLSGPRPYFSSMCLLEVRLAVRLETFMVDCAGNMKEKYKGRLDCFMCDGEEVDHLEII